ncbi:MAG: type II toxin-antitoxin system YafQ family toxin [gamma proteobacterium symbiont of Taylorina sp.]|nr:type II toxin-antitoxin system YafQ family toxin [gamma proteobacterium symbiont of Taylorina sp.]
MKRFFYNDTKSALDDVWGKDYKFTTSFKKDLKCQKKREKSRDKIETVIKFICTDGDVPAEYIPHNLSGNWKRYRECHIEPDWLLIYSVESDELAIFYRTGTHSS